MIGREAGSDILWLTIIAFVLAVLAGMRGCPSAGECNDTANRLLPILRMHSECSDVERRSAAYHRAKAARSRRLLADATTRWLKEHLQDEIARQEQIAAEVERASEPDTSPRYSAAAVSSETPG